ncbi:MAG: sugar ABC transporter permease, partial [Phycisphaerae bacterium]|nr:sugar ABC transporter permease [Phycisphaerae bacterium]
GPRMIIFVAGIQNISEELYEAASLDGCVGWRRFRSITLPMLAPTLLFVSVTTTIAAFQLFTPVYVMTKGGPDRSTDVVLFHIFKELWWRREIGMASAMSCVLLVMILLIAAFQLYVMRRGLHTEESR